MREGLDDLDAALDQDVGPAAVIAGDAADQDAERKADDDADQPDGQRDPRAVDDPRQQVAAEPVGAEQEHLPARRRAGQVHIAVDIAPEFVRVAMTQPAERLILCRVGRVHPMQIGHVETVIVAQDERGAQAALVEQAHALRRRVDEIGVPAVEPVGREKLAEQDDQVERQQQRARYDRDAVPAKAPPHQPPLRGAVEPLLRRRHDIDRVGVERGRRDEMRQWLAADGPVRFVRGRRSGGDADFAHCWRPTWRRMRGSSAASARSDRNTPITVRNAMNIRNEPARNISWLRSASSSIGPVVGNDMTIDTTAAPEMTCGSREPISEMNGLSARRSGYLNNSLTGGRPLARAVTTYCFCNSSSRLARSRRIMLAVPAVPITMTGIQICANTDMILAHDHGAST